MTCHNVSPACPDRAATIVGIRSTSVRPNFQLGLRLGFKFLPSSRPRSQACPVVVEQSETKTDPALP